MKEGVILKKGKNIIYIFGTQRYLCPSSSNTGEDMSDPPAVTVKFVDLISRNDDLLSLCWFIVDTFLTTHL